LRKPLDLVSHDQKVGKDKARCFFYVQLLKWFILYQYCLDQERFSQVIELYLEFDSIQTDQIDFNMLARTSLLLRFPLQFVNFSEIFGMATKRLISDSDDLLSLFTEFKCYLATETFDGVHIIIDCREVRVTFCPIASKQTTFDVLAQALCHYSSDEVCSRAINRLLQKNSPMYMNRKSCANYSKLLSVSV
jgi:hypothetical protein